MTEAESSAHAGEAVTGHAYVPAYLATFAAHWFGARRFDRVSHDGFNPADMQAYRTHKVEHLKRNFLRSEHVRAAEPPASAAAAAQAPPADAREAGEAGTGAPEVQVKVLRQVPPRFVFAQCFFMVMLYTMFALKKNADDGMTGTDSWLAGLDSISRGSTDLRWAGPKCEDLRHEIWRWITYQYTHIGVGHLFTNCVLLIVFGTSLEGHEGSRRMFLLWHAGVMGGALCWLVGGAHGYVVGSSGGVYSLIGVQFEDLLVNWRVRHFNWTVLFILLAFALLDAVTWWWSMDLTKSDYSYATAFGGGLVGLIFGAYIGRSYRLTKKDKSLIFGLSLIGLSLVLFAWMWLLANKAPLNIWEAGEGESGWCWAGQFFSARQTKRWECVRCASTECVEEWTSRKTMLSVSLSTCEAQGWYSDER